MNPLIRLYVACGLFSCWLVLLLLGFSLAGGIHLLFFLALGFFPWRRPRRP